MIKGQAALEFLATYGWAIMVVLVMIGALAYFGVFEAQDALPEKCILSPGIDCVDFMINATTLKIYVLNNIGSALSFISLNSTSCGSTMSVNGISGGSKVELSCPLNVNVPAPGNKLRAPIVITYMKEDGAYPKIVYGEIYATVQ